MMRWVRPFGPVWACAVWLTAAACVTSDKGDEDGAVDDMAPLDTGLVVVPRFVVRVHDLASCAATTA